MNRYTPHRPPLAAWLAVIIAALGMMSCEARADEVILTETPGEPVWATITVKNRCGSPPSYEDVIDTHRGPVTVEWTRSLPCWTPSTPGVGPDVLTILTLPPDLRTAHARAAQAGHSFGRRRAP